ncbi:hypothetical protein BRADI_2g05205v3 [Brachypodium distachyon]|uniref:Uncharacterized protein n=1 Tax=Brachypodium distachyon TaxID=15368 RepID=A0A2K2D728_BRADI|nr:hypothetical protein BRADI_2g05205v3 [Brachypodium distachyon]
MLEPVTSPELAAATGFLRPGSACSDLGPRMPACSAMVPRNCLPRPIPAAQMPARPPVLPPQVAVSAFTAAAVGIPSASAPIPSCDM